MADVGDIEVRDDPIDLLERAWERAEKAQSYRNEVYRRLWLRYKGFVETVSDPYRSNMSIPKAHSIIETITPRLGKALFGSRPYIPLAVERDEFRDAASAIESAMDVYLHKDKFEAKGIQMIKMIGCFGTSFLEPHNDTELVTEKRLMQSPIYPFSIGIEKEVVRRFRLKTRLWAPWQVYVEPNMRSLTDYGYVILVDEISRKEVEDHYQVDLQAKLKEAMDNSSPGGDTRMKYFETMLTSLGIARPEDDDTYGILMRYLSRDRVVTAWNGLVPLEDKPGNGQRIDLTRVIYNEDPMPQNSFWGQGELKIIEELCDKLDETWNITFDNHDMINHAVLGYREGAVDIETAVWMGGTRIKIKKGFSGTFDDAIRRLDTQGLPADHYQIPAMLERFIDLTSGVFDITRGESTQAPGKEKTATESSLLFQHADMRSEMKVKIIEMIGLADFADLCTRIIDDFADPDDLYEVLGERASDIITMNPYDIPGGFDWQFKGSSTISEDFRKRADWRETIEVLRDSPAWRPGAMERETMMIQGRSKKEVDRLLWTEEEMFMLMQQQAALQSAEADAQGGNVKKRNTPQQPTIAAPAGV